MITNKTAAMSDTDFVDDKFKQDALRRLRERIAEGETEEQVTGITDKFYRNKVVQGLGAMSYRIYDRIMGCSEEDGIPVS